MDPRSPGHHSFARPLSQPTPRDPRQAPIPPPSYTRQPQSAPRPQTFFNNDLFLSRKNDRDGSLGDIGLPTSSSLGQGPLSFHQYAANAPRETSGSTTDMSERQQDSRAQWSTCGDGRVDRYGSQSIEASSSLPPPPPPPSSTYRPPALHASNILDDPTRQPGHRTSSPRMYGVSQTSLPPPPPPQPFGGRHMPPPTSPQYTQAPSNRDPPPPSPFGGGRELPALSMNNRSGSSMSISSMLGTDASKPSRDPPPSPYANGNHSFQSSQQQSTKAASPTWSGKGDGFRHQGSPEAQNHSQGSMNRPFRAYSGGLPQPSLSTNKTGSPVTGTLRFGLRPNESFSHISPRSDTGTQQDRRHNNTNTSVGRMLDRPSSQPSGYHSSPPDIDRRAQDIDARQSELARQEEEIARKDGPASANRDRSSNFDLAGRQALSGRQEASAPVFQPPTQGSARDDRPNPSKYPFLTQSSGFAEPASAGSRSDTNVVNNRLLEPDLNSPASLQKGPYGAEALRRLREERLGAAGTQQQGPTYSTANSRLRFLDSLDDRRAQIDPRSSPSAVAMRRSASNDGAPLYARNGEELVNHRNSLAMMLDNSKRAGRASPLPQAVQGAQGRTDGPSRDPSIKNEFSRMFAGIRSGVSSSGLAGSGTSTPFPPSPRPSAENEQRPAFIGRNDLIKPPESRNGSRMGKRSKKIKDDEAKEAAFVDGRTVAGNNGARGAKRSKHNHHHHVHGHHHHHHREELTPLRAISNNHSTTPVPHHHHHHHHHHPDGTIHVHHYSKQIAPPKAVVPRIPLITIDNNQLLQSLQNLPRRHLGSTLYAPTFEHPDPSAIVDTKLSDAGSQCTIPRCEGKENCTLTVRIPRFYLHKDERERACRQRALWGSDVYTDDSDPLAAAIHAGWIQGEWGDDIDISMIELNPVPEEQAELKDKTLTIPPSSPILPPANKDLHLTLLILPTLQSYASRVAHGIKSRPWGGNHDGMSFRIEKIAWVDEGVGRSEERGGLAQRKRIEELRLASSGGGAVVKVALGMAGGSVVAATA